MPALAALEAPRANVHAKRFYRPELDIVRLAAFALVFLHHSLPMDVSVYEKYLPRTLALAATSIAGAGGFGLSLFFFLSAFLITNLLTVEAERTGTVLVRDFYIRRFLRIWPLYTLGLGIGAIFVCTHPSGASAWVMIIMFAIMAGNWFFAAGGQAPNNPVTPLWSISVEEQFYLLWPSIAKFGGRRAIAWTSLAMVGFAVAVEFTLGHTHAERNMVIWSNTFVGFQFFAAGALTALLLQRVEFQPTLWGRGVLVLGAFATWFIANFAFGAKALGPAPNGVSIVVGYALITAGAVCVLLALWRWTRWHPTLIRLGRISYGLYVFHMFALDAVDYLIGKLAPNLHAPLLTIPARAALALMITVALAETSYRLLETPFLRMKERFAAVQSRPI